MFVIDAIKSAENIFFQAEYNFGKVNQQIKPQNQVVSMIQALVICLFKTMIYPGASFLRGWWIDESRTIAAKNQLIEIGGKPVKMKTPDGDTIDGMHLDTADFKNHLMEYFDVIENYKEDGATAQKLILKESFCIPVQKDLDGKPYTYLKPDKQIESYLDNLKAVGLYVKPEGLISNENGNVIRGITIELPDLPAGLPKILNGDVIASSPTALIGTGSGMTYPAYKGLAVAYLLRGINVMMIDFRGYGESTGNPTAYRTKLDMETAYQYLVQEKVIQKKDIIAHGHCLGGGAASDLAARRRGVNLILDRSFAEFKDVAKNRFPLISNIVSKIIPWIVDYNNSKNIKNIKANIAIVAASDDEVIDKEQVQKQIESLPNTTKGQTFSLLTSTGGHTGLWTDHEITSLQFNQFLEKIKLRRQVF
jgi:predicted alpha/beta-fold hydrolase